MKAQLHTAINIARNWSIEDVASLLVFPAVAIVGLCLFAVMGGG